MDKKLFFGLFTIFVLMLAGCSVVTGPSADSNEWKTYLNEDYGYSFEVPSFCYEGPLLGECKQKPPEERTQECLCFINGEDKDNVVFQHFTGEVDKLFLAGVTISSPNTSAFRPPSAADLVQYVQQEFGDFYQDIPDASNIMLDDVPALKISVAGSPMAPAYDEIFFLHADQLFKINLLDPTIESNSDLYNHILASFAFGE